MEHIGKNIKRIRQEKNMTIADLANEHISAGMISLIENNKTKPSIDRLQHIATNLNVPLSDILGKYSRKELRKIIQTFKEKAKLNDPEMTIEQLEKLQNLLPHLGEMYETAIIHELIARHTYFLFALHPEPFKELSNQDWKYHAEKAISLFNQLQMEWRALSIKVLLANASALEANYEEAIEIVDKALKEDIFEDNKDAQATYIDLLYIKAMSLESLGKREEAYAIAQKAIDYMKKHFIMNRFFEINNMVALLLYDNFRFSEARKIAEQVEQFVTLTENDELWLDMLFNQIHYNEFYEENFKRAYELIDQTKEALETERYAHLADYQIKDVHTFLKDAKARCLTREGKYEQAIPIFENNEHFIPEHITMNPVDTSLRIISKSYLARCYYRVGKRKEARKLAYDTFNILSDYPHTSYYFFAREVLREVTR